MHLSLPRALRALAVVTALALTVTLAPLGATSTPPAAAIPIEGYPAYQPQSKCSPSAKLGTVLLSEHLLKRYRGSGSSGISRACTASGVSEHKEGRAFDWRLDARSSRDRGYAKHFLERIRATDRAGNSNALARRMGIMYVIWNDRIWSASRNYRGRAYLHAACKQRKGCSTTLRHRDHMHISLTRAAARAKTSWYVQRITPSAPKVKPEPKPKPKAKPRPKAKAEPKAKARSKPTPKPARKPEPRSKPRSKPKPDPKPATMPKRAPRRADGIVDLRPFPYTRVRVPANGETVETRFKVRGGVTYSVTAAGLYSWGEPDQVADAVCTWSRKDQAWVPRPRRTVKRKYGALALVVNGKRPFDDKCRGSHKYRTELVTKHDRTLKLRVVGKHPTSRGRVTVVIGRKRAKVAPALPDYPDLTPAPTYSTNPRMGTGLTAETVRLRATAGATWTRGSLAPRATYRVTVSGVVRLGNHVRSNGRCVKVRGTWYDAASIDPRVPAQDHGQLYVDGAPFEGTSEAGSCTGNVHVGDYTPDGRGRVRLDLWDPLERSNNHGELSVKVQRLTPIATPGPARTERPRPRKEQWKMRRQLFTVDASRRRGSVSRIHLRKGQTARIAVVGRFRSGGKRADASCVRTSAGWQRTDPDVLLGQDPLNVWVDGRAVRWRPLGGGKPCSDERRYVTRFTATKPGPVRVSVFDLDHSDNRGTLDVAIKRLKR